MRHGVYDSTYGELVSSSLVDLQTIPGYVPMLIPIQCSIDLPEFREGLRDYSLDIYSSHFESVDY